jgi:hypothetical protein
MKLLLFSYLYCILAMSDNKYKRGLPSKKSNITVTANTITKESESEPIISNTSQIEDDLQFALALSQSEEALYNNADEGAAAAAFGLDEELLRLRKEQEAADEEFARELARQMEAEYNPPPQQQQQHQSQNYDEQHHSHPRGQESDQESNQESGNDVEEHNRGQYEVDAYFEELSRREAAERLQKEGHAYRAKPNIDRILASEEQKEAELLSKAKRSAELKAWREERDRQDAEYQAMLEHDMLVAAGAFDISAPSDQSKEDESEAEAEASTHNETEPDADTKDEPQDESEPEPEPLPPTKEAIRKARLAFFLKKQ